MDFYKLCSGEIRNFCPSRESRVKNHRNDPIPFQAKRSCYLKLPPMVVPSKGVPITSAPASWGRGWHWPAEGVEMATVRLLIVLSVCTPAQQRLIFTCSVSKKGSNSENTMKPVKSLKLHYSGSQVCRYCRQRTWLLKWFRWALA